MENEPQILPSGADSLGGESGQETGEDSSGWGGRGAGCAGGMHRGHTIEQLLMQPGEREPTESFLEEVELGFV